MRASLVSPNDPSVELQFVSTCCTVVWLVHYLFAPYQSAVQSPMLSFLMNLGQPRD